MLSLLLCKVDSNFMKDVEKAIMMPVVREAKEIKEEISARHPG